MIRMNNIFKYYTNKFIKTYVLNDLSLELNEGEFLTVMGPSGAVKSTLLYILGMLDEASQGEYYFNDSPVVNMGLDCTVLDLAGFYSQLVSQK